MSVIEIRIAGRYKIGRKIEQRSYCSVYLGRNV